MGKPMSEIHKSTLRRHRPDLTGHMDNFMIIEHLTSEEFLSLGDKESILAEGAPSKQNGVLLDILIKKPDAVYYSLIKALLATRQEHLAGPLLQEGNVIQLIISSPIFPKRTIYCSRHCQPLLILLVFLFVTLEISCCTDKRDAQMELRSVMISTRSLKDDYHRIKIRKYSSPQK